MMRGTSTRSRGALIEFPRMTTLIAAPNRQSTNFAPAVAALALAFCLAAPGFGAEPADNKMVFSPLPAKSLAALNAQRAWVDALARRICGKPTGVDARTRVAVLQCLFDKHAVDHDDETGWSAVGVAFGDALVAAHAGLEWRQVEDSYGVAASLQYKRKKIEVAPIDMVLKRIDRGDTIDFDDLVRATGEAIEQQLREAADDK